MDHEETYPTMKKLILTLLTVAAVAVGVTAVSAAVSDDPRPAEPTPRP